MTELDQALVRSTMDDFSDELGNQLDRLGLERTDSIVFRRWGLAIVWDAEKLVCYFLKPEGIPQQLWIAEKDQVIDPDAVNEQLVLETGATVLSTIILPLPTAKPIATTHYDTAVGQHIAEIQRSKNLGLLGNITGMEHLEPALREFLRQHPDPTRNIFVMMRFRKSDQMSAIHEAIRSTLEPMGYHTIRADDRDYTDELWTNVQVCMTGSKYGIAVFEDIDDRDFNPNVSLELGYMLASRKRCLILKEKRLPKLPADVVHRLYKDFDMFQIDESISQQVNRWLRIDLNL